MRVFIFFLVGLLLSSSAAPEGLLVIRVQDEQGNPIKNAKIMESLDRHVSGDDGLIRVPDIPVDMVDARFTLTHPDYVPQPVHIVFEAGVDRYDIPIVMPRGATVTGRVFDEKGLPIGGARVTIYMDVLPLMEGRRIQSMQTDERGCFELHGIVPDQDGFVDINAFQRGFRETRLRRSLASLDGEPVNLQLRSKEASPQIQGRVAFASGQPPQRGEIRFESDDPDCSHFYPRTAKVNESGNFSFDALPEGECEGILIYELTEPSLPPEATEHIAADMIPEPRVQQHLVWRSEPLRIGPGKLLTPVFNDLNSFTIEVAPPPSLPDDDDIEVSVYRKANPEERHRTQSIVVESTRIDSGKIFMRDRLDTGEYFAQVSIQGKPELRWGSHFTLSTDDPTPKSLRFLLPKIPCDETDQPGERGAAFSDTREVIRSAARPIGPRTGERIRGSIRFEDGSPVQGALTHLDGFRPGKSDGMYEAGVKGDPPHLAFDMHSVRGWPGVPNLRRSFIDFVLSDGPDWTHHVSCVVYVPVQTDGQTQDIVLKRGPTRTLTVHAFPREEDLSGQLPHRYPSDQYSWSLAIDADDYWMGYYGNNIPQESAGEMAYWLDEERFVIHDVPEGRTVLSYRGPAWSGTIEVENDQGDQTIDLRDTPAGSVSGRVRFMDGGAYDGVMSIKSMNAPERPYGVAIPGEILPKIPAVSATVIAENGKFSFPHLRPGQYKVSASEFYRSATLTVEVRVDETTHTDLELRPETHPPGLPLLEAPLVLGGTDVAEE